MTNSNNQTSDDSETNGRDIDEMALAMELNKRGAWFLQAFKSMHNAQSLLLAVLHSKITGAAFSPLALNEAQALLNRSYELIKMIESDGDVAGDPDPDPTPPPSIIAS